MIGQTCTNKSEPTVCTLEHSVCTSSKCACKTGYTNKDDTCFKGKYKSSYILIIIGQTKF